MDTAAVAVLQVVAAGERRSARQGGLCVLFTSAKERAGRCDAHRGPVSSREDLQGGRRRTPAAVVDVALTDRSTQGLPGLLIHRGRFAGGPAEVKMGSRWSGDQRRHGFAGEEVLTGGDFDPKIAALHRSRS